MEENTRFYGRLFPVGSRVEINGERYFIWLLNAPQGKLMAHNYSRIEEINLLDHSIRDINKI